MICSIQRRRLEPSGKLPHPATCTNSSHSFSWSTSRECSSPMSPPPSHLFLIFYRNRCTFLLWSPWLWHVMVMGPRAGMCLPGSQTEGYISSSLLTHYRNQKELLHACDASPLWCRGSQIPTNGKWHWETYCLWIQIQSSVERRYAWLDKNQDWR